MDVTLGCSERMDFFITLYNSHFPCSHAYLRKDETMFEYVYMRKYVYASKQIREFSRTLEVAATTAFVKGKS